MKWHTDQLTRSNIDYLHSELLRCLKRECAFAFEISGIPEKIRNPKIKTMKILLIDKTNWSAINIL